MVHIQHSTSKSCKSWEIDEFWRKSRRLANMQGFHLIVCIKFVRHNSVSFLCRATSQLHPLTGVTWFRQNKADVLVASQRCRPLNTSIPDVNLYNLISLKLLSEGLSVNSCTAENSEHHPYTAYAAFGVPSFSSCRIFHNMRKEEKLRIRMRTLKNSWFVHWGTICTSYTPLVFFQWSWISTASCIHAVDLFRERFLFEEMWYSKFCSHLIRFGSLNGMLFSEINIEQRWQDIRDKRKIFVYSHFRGQCNFAR